MAWQWVPIADIMGTPGAVPALSTLYYKRDLATGENLNSLTVPGVYNATSQAIANSLLNAPDTEPAVYIVAGPNSGIRTQLRMSNAGGFMLRTISTATGTFGPWIQLDGRGRTIPDGTNIQTFRDLGPWRIASTVSANTMTNRPPIPAGPAQITNLSYNGTNGSLRIWHDVNGNGVWFQSLNSSAVWTDWEKLGFVRDYNAGHTVRVQRERQSTGGTIGTGGLGVFAIRIDHNMVGMMTKLLPMLTARGLPASMCHFVNQFAPDAGYTGDNSTGYGWSDVQSLVLNHGIEPWSHGWSHQDAVGPRALEKEILSARTEIETQLAKCRLKGMMIPGTTNTFWGGFTNNLADPSVWFNTEAGRLVMFNFASANGGGGVLNPLASGQTLGWQSYSVDTHTTSASAISMLKKAQDTKTGGVIMLHPNMIDAPGGITSAVLGEILDYMVAERAAGRAMVLTVSGMLNADPERTTRHNLVRDSAFTSGLTNYAGTAGWTAAAGVASTSTGGLLSQSFVLADHNYAAGSTRELYMEVRATAGAIVKLRASDSTTPANFDTSSGDVTLPASSDWVTVRKILSIPTTGTATVKLEYGRVSGGLVEIRKPSLLAI
ncbi:hypothetical protein SAMN04487912_102339 [Arthrobacter sp. cf158]|uniref:hypothetical protein n=1 Tax=Arthrobacter sp. cf158 TaxID=1761744 RepID=UPI00089BF3FC|nr:hypothetical protein [Arthrobacter sp. cf158]SDW32709.1 hypothetical protein SAMN04487912_102339 [Arthrobacter sp. cf158]